VGAIVCDSSDAADHLAYPKTALSVTTQLRLAEATCRAENRKKKEKKTKKKNASTLTSNGIPPFGGIKRFISERKARDNVCRPSERR